MTDLTRLLASLKRRSAHVKEFGDDITFVKLEDLDALVEALEKAWQRNGELETYSKTALEFREAARDENRHLKLELEIAEKRIASLEESHAQVIQSRDHYKRMLEEGLEQLAEPRTVTVKLPDIMPPEAAPAHYWGSGESMAYAEGYNKSAVDLKTSFTQACSSVGVNVEFE
ncbi:TPA: hypothetical protein ACIJR6_005375 [Klebsiella aerogenes]